MKTPSSKSVLLEVEPGEGGADAGVDPNHATDGGIDITRGTTGFTAGTYVAREDLATAAFTGSYHDLKNVPESTTVDVLAEIESLSSHMADFISALGRPLADPAEHTVQDRLDTINASLISQINLAIAQIDAFKAEAKSESDDLQSRVGEAVNLPAANTLLDRLKQIKDQLAANSATGDAHASTLTAAIQAVETDIEAFHASFNTRDLSTESTLAAFKAESKVESDETQALIGEISATPTANTVMDRLRAIYEAVDTLEITAESINLNTDEVEAKLDAVNASIAQFNAAFDNRDVSTESTLSAFKSQSLTESNETQTLLSDTLGSVSALPAANTVLDRLKQLRDSALADNATSHGKLDLVIAELQDIEADIELFKAAFDARDLATNATLTAFKDEQKIESDETQALLQTEFDETQAIIQAESDETQALIGEATALPTANTLMDRLKQIKDQLISNDAGGDAKLDGIISELQDIEADLELTESNNASRHSALTSTLTTEFNDLTVDQAARLVDLKSHLTSESTTSRSLLQSEMDDLQSKVGEVSLTPTANTLQDRLKQIYEAVDGLELSVDNIDLDMEQVEAGLATLDASVNALKSAFDARDLATESTLAAFKAESKVESDATQAILQTEFDETQAIIQAESDETQALIGQASLTPTANTIMDRLKQVKDQLISNDSGSDAKFDLVIAELQDIEADLEAFHSSFNTRDLAAETTLSAFKVEQKTESDATQALLQSEFDATQSLIQAESDETQALLGSTLGEVSLSPTANTLLDRLKQLKDQLVSNDSGSDAKFDLVIAELQDLEVDLEAFHSSFNVRDLAKDTTLIQVRDYLDTAESKLQAIIDNTDTLELNTDQLEAKLDAAIAAIQLFNTQFNSRDLSQESTLANFKAEAKAESDASQALIGEVGAAPTANTVLDRLKQVKEQLVANAGNDDANTAGLAAAIQAVEADLEAFNANFVARDLASNSTLTAFKNEQKVESDETQAAITSFNTEFSNRDLATDTVLQALKQLMDSRNSRPSTLVNAQFEVGQRIETDDGQSNDHLYIGRNTVAAATSDLTWEVIRIRRNADGLTLGIDYLDGISWDGRVTAWT